MDRYRLGEVELVRLVDGSLETPAPAPMPAWCVPDYAPSTDTATLAFAAFALAIDGLRIVVDPWLVTDGSREQPGADAHADRLAAELADAGFPVEEVDLVVLTHLDGVGWSIRPGDPAPVPMFPNARYVLAKTGVDAWHDGSLGGSTGLADLLAAGVVDEVDTDATISDHVTLVPTEGHTVGHAAVRVRTGGPDLVLAGHLFIYPNQVSDPTIANDFDPEQAATERRALLADLAAQGATLFGQLLGGRGGGVVHVDGDGYRLEPIEGVGVVG